MLIKLRNKLILLLFFVFNVETKEKNICIISPIVLNNNSLYFESKFKARDEVNKPFYMLVNKLKELGYTISFLDKNLKSEKKCTNSDYILFFGPDISLIKKFEKYNNSKKIYFSFEPPIIMPKYLSKFYQNKFTKLFILLDDFTDNQKVFKFFYPQPDLKIIKKNIPFSKKKLCTFVSGFRKSFANKDLYNERIKLVKFFENNYPADFDLYGVNWPSTYKCYKGQIKNKKNYLKYYKFCICYENSRYNGYITEKIFDAMVSGCVPIYLGAYNITKYIPENCFIDRSKFKSEQELYNFLKKMDEEVYNKYLENIQNFLKSSKAQQFSIKNFINTVVKAFEK